MTNHPLAKEAHVAARIKPSTLDQAFKLTLLIFAVIAFMYLAAEVLQPLALAILLSFALTPLSRLLEGRGVPRMPAVALTLALALGLFAGIGYVVGTQLTALADRLPDYQENIVDKLSILKPEQETALDKAARVAGDVARTLDRPAVPGSVAEARRMAEASEPGGDISEVRVVSQPSFRERLEGSIGPFLEPLAVGSIVVILVLFMMARREEMADRIIRLVGQGRITVTTKSMEEVGQRIGRFLAIFTGYNSAIGLVFGLGLWAIGVPYPALWGFLAAALRFIPYAGPTAAFVLPVVFSIAHFPTWREPLMVIGLFAVVETISNSLLEPIIYGKTAGVSVVGLLVAAMFWTWLWGALGLLLSTPLTVCLAVLGKYVPGLGFFATLLGEEAELDPDARFYQRLVALDRDGAIAVADEAFQRRPRVEVFDSVLIPALSRAERDSARGDLDEREQAFIWRTVGQMLDELEVVPDLGQSLANPPAGGGEGPAAPLSIVGVAASDTSDVLVLRMLGQVVAPTGVSMEIIHDANSPLRVADRVDEVTPQLLVLSHLPPEGLTLARYLMLRLRARFPELPIVVGRWDESGSAVAVAEQLNGMGAKHVAFTLAEARDCILGMASAGRESASTVPAQPT